MAIYQKKLFVFITALLLLVLVISAVFTAVSLYERPYRFFFFPGVASKALNEEKRRLERRESSEADIRYYLRELILGPMHMEYTRVIPRTTKIRALILSGNKLYMDFSQDILWDDSECFVNLADGLKIIEKSIRFNFPFVKKITITVEGNQ